MMTARRVLLLAALVAPCSGACGVFEASPASADTGYSADCASVSQGEVGNRLSYEVTNQCGVGVIMNALLTDGNSSGCQYYAPGQTLSFDDWGGALDDSVQDVVYCSDSGNINP